MLDTPKTTLEMRNLDDPDERRTPGNAVLDIVNLPGATIVRGTMQPGWKWSTDLAPVVGTDSCQVAHSGVVVSGWDATCFPSTYRVSVLPSAVSTALCAW